tara:strand:+ start:4106 stop:4207 length:102 start_codon:yes stop_codon:yes gene_type:complete
MEKDFKEKGESNIIVFEIVKKTYLTLKCKIIIV